MPRAALVAALLAALAGLPSCAGAPPSTEAPASTAVPRHIATLEVTGLPMVRQLDVATMESLGGKDVTWAHHAGQHLYRCTSLFAILTHCGLEPGVGGPSADPRSKHGGWRRVVHARAADGFDAVFSSAELSPDIGPSEVLVAWMVDGRPLPASEGPLRLLVPTDKKGSRSIRGLVRVDVSAAPR